MKQLPDIPKRPQENDRQRLFADLGSAPFYAAEAAFHALLEFQIARRYLALRPDDRHMQESVVKQLMEALARMRDATDLDMRTLALWAVEEPLKLTQRGVAAFGGIPESTLRSSWIKEGWEPDPQKTTSLPPAVSYSVEEDTDGVMIIKDMITGELVSAPKKPRYSTPRKRKTTKENRMFTAEEKAYEKRPRGEGSKGA